MALTNISDRERDLNQPSATPCTKSYRDPHLTDENRGGVKAQGHAAWGAGGAARTP